MDDQDKLAARIASMPPGRKKDELEALWAARLRDTPADDAPPASD